MIAATFALWGAAIGANPNPSNPNPNWNIVYIASIEGSLHYYANAKLDPTQVEDRTTKTNSKNKQQKPTERYQK